MNITIENENKLVVNGKVIQEIKDGEVEKFIELNDHIYLLLYFPNGHSEQNTNIWKLNLQGNIIWKIEQFGSDEMGASPYVELNYEKDKLVTSNWKGVDFYIDAKSGEINVANKGRRPW